ncbi:MAG: molybdopterin-dependent oxidoreductase [Alphaproteobacteria bacterium]|nr:molybdopterin-dependent oxidoreductase [Alphaproteobacteria bacterium]
MRTISEFGQAVAGASVSRRENVAGICGVCPGGCGVEVHLVDGRIERLTPLKGHPLGIVCPRGARAREIVYSKDRILYPQRRVGPRGAGRLERISWDEAWEVLVGALRKTAAEYGPEAAAIYTGRGNFEFGLTEFFAPEGTSESSANAVLFPFGSPNSTGVGSLCYAAHGMIAPEACFGDHLRNFFEDIDNADLVLVWGANPATDSPPVNLRKLKHARQRGARVIVIDHRRSETARAVGAEWIGIRPGTDGALALGALHVLIAEGLYDRTFADNWTHGFAELRAYVAAFDPDRVARITHVPADTVRALARAVAAARGCSFLMYTGLEYSNSGVQAVRAAWTLQALAGHLEVPGGKLFRMAGRTRSHRHLTAPPEGARKPVGADAFPLYHGVRNEAHAAALPGAIIDGVPYPVRAMIIGGASVITAWPDPARWRRALAALDFLAVIERFPTADMAYADLVLPAATMFEIESYMIHDGYIQRRAPVIAPLGEARSDYVIYAGLAQRLGYGHLWPQTEAAMVETALEGTGVTRAMLIDRPEGMALPVPEMQYRKYAAGLLRADGKPGFATPTGRFEIASEWLRAYGYDALPVYNEPSEGPLASPHTARRYPLVFNSGARTQSAFRSQHHNIPSLAALQPDPLVHMHPDDAAVRGIADGDAVVVTSPRGRVPFRARVTENILPGVVEANMGGGGPLGSAAWQAANVNQLSDPANFDRLSGFPVYKALLCDVELATRAGPAPA